MGRAAPRTKPGEIGTSKQRLGVSEPMRPRSRSLPMLLLRAREAVMNRFRPNLRDHGFTDQQWRVLRVLDDSGAMPISMLAEECCLLMPSLSRILQNLEGRGLVSRTGAVDQRSYLISITPAGRALYGKAAPISEARYVEIAELVGKERLEEIYAVLEELIAALEQTEPATAAGDERDGQKT
jgi:homoprotocatechuate degradation regulator HpaR